MTDRLVFRAKITRSEFIVNSGIKNFSYIPNAEILEQWHHMFPIPMTMTRLPCFLAN